MNKRIKSLVMLVPFAAGLISGDAVFASSSLEKSKMLIGRGKKNLADAVDKNDVNCDEELSLSGNKTENKIKDISDKNTQASRFGLLGFLGINGAIASIGITNFSTKELVKLLQKDKEKEKITPSNNNSNSSPGPVGLTPSNNDSNSSPGPVGLSPSNNDSKSSPGSVGLTPSNNDSKSSPGSVGLTPSNNDSNSSPGPVGPTTIKEKPHGDISLWIKENPTVFSLFVTLFTFFLFFHVRDRIAINKLNEEIKKSNEEIKKSNEEIKELNEILDLNEIDKEIGIDKKLNKEIDEEINNISSKAFSSENIKYNLEFIKNYKRIIKKIRSGNTGETLTLELQPGYSLEIPNAMARAFFPLIGRFYDPLGGFWYVVTDEDKIKEEFKNNFSLTPEQVYPENATKINIKFFSIDDYLTRLRNQFNKIISKKFYDENFRRETGILLAYYDQYFAIRLTAPYRDCEEELKSKLELDDVFLNKYQSIPNGRDKSIPNGRDKLLNFIREQARPEVFYTFLSMGGCLSQIYDDRDRVSPEIRIRFIKYAIKKLIKDKDGRYNLSHENKIFLKYRFNALLLFGELIYAYYKKEVGSEEKDSLPSNTFKTIINRRGFHYLVLNWCKENIKNKSLVSEDDEFKNKVIFLLARREAEYLIDLGGEKNDGVEETFGEILDIYKGSNNNINNITDIVNDNNNDVIKDVKDVSINFEQIQFMK